MERCTKLRGECHDGRCYDDTPHACHDVNCTTERLRKQLADAQATVEALQRERDALEAKCLEEHVTIEQADAKVMKLEGEKGMWANERIDLLAQLENAEFALDAEREKVRGLEALQVGFDGQDEVLDIKKSDYYALRDELSQLQALVSGMKSIIPHQHCRTCNQYADELRNYDIWGKRTLDATTPNSNQLGAINDMVRKEATVSEAQRMQNEMNGLVEIYRLKGELLELRDERDRLRANLVNCVARLEAYYGEDYPAVRDAKAALTPAGGGQAQ